MAVVGHSSMVFANVVVEASSMLIYPRGKAISHGLFVGGYADNYLGP